MPHLLLIFSQSDCLIQIVAINSHTWWQTVQIQISWLLQKPADLDLHCLQRQGISGFSRTRVKIELAGKNMDLLIYNSYLYRWKDSCHIPDCSGIGLFCWLYSHFICSPLSIQFLFTYSHFTQCVILPIFFHLASFKDFDSEENSVLGENIVNYLTLPW